MPTDEWFRENPKVSAYIPKELNEKLSNWMKDRSIKKVSQALTTILEEHLGVVQTEPITQPVRDDRLATLEVRFECLSEVVQDLKELIQASSPRVVQIELLPVEPIEETWSETETIAPIDSRQPIEVMEEEIQDDEPDKTLPRSLKVETQSDDTKTDEGVKPEMTVKEVADFLNWSNDKVGSRHKRNQIFEEKGYRFTPTKQSGRRIWETKRLETQ